MIGILANFACEGPDQFWQPLLLETKGIKAEYFGLLMADGAMVAILLSKLTKSHYEGIWLYLFVNFLIIAFSLAIVAKFGPGLAGAGIIAYFALRETYRPVLSYHLNKGLSSENRASIISTYNLACSLGEILAGLLIGWIALQIGLLSVFWISAIMSTFLAVTYYCIRRNKNSPS
jgi:MFS family permease